MSETEKSCRELGEKTAGDSYKLPLEGAENISKKLEILILSGAKTAYTEFSSPEKRAFDKEPSRDTAMEEERSITHTSSKSLLLQRDDSLKEEGEISDSEPEEIDERVQNVGKRNEFFDLQLEAFLKEERKISKYSESRASRFSGNEKSSKYSSEKRSHESRPRSRNNLMNRKTKSYGKRGADSKFKQIQASSPRKSERKVLRTVNN